MIVTLSSLSVIPVLRILLKWGYKWNLLRQPCLESLFSLMSMTITFALQKRSLYLAVSWTLSVFIVLITLSSAWWWSHISNVLSVLVKAVHVWVWCGNHWTASTISWSQKFFKLRKNKPASSQSFLSYAKHCVKLKIVLNRKLFVC